jgi:ubiquinone/menaquinone biosynthesis C-methylase UbiE
MPIDRRFNYYDAIARVYDRTRWLTNSVAEEITDFILNLVNATPETTFLEPGVGTGLNVFPLVKRGYSVTGIDISQEMLARFRQKLGNIPVNLTLICGDASQLPFPDKSFDVILTVHMLHCVSNWRHFLAEIDRVLKPGGFYLNCQWITPPARREFEGHFRRIIAKYKDFKPIITDIPKIDLENYFHRQGYTSNYFVAKEWMVSNTINELLEFLRLRAYGLCWQVSDETFERAINKFEEFCIEHYSSLENGLSSPAKFEIWAYRRFNG